MVYLSTSEEWQRQASLLLQARPTTTRVTTKYKIPNLEEARYQRPRKRIRQDDAHKEEKATPKIPRATLILKAYDAESGVCLKFSTDRAAEVGRLIHGLGRVGRHMAALPAKDEDIAMEDTHPIDAQQDISAGANINSEAKTIPPIQSGGGKKKKKGKK